MLRPLTHGSRWRTSWAARSRFANTRSCEGKKTSKPRQPCWQSGKRRRNTTGHLEYKCPRRAVGACVCTCSLGLAPGACAYTCGLGLGLARLVRGLHGKCGTPPSTSGCSGVKGQIRGASLPGAACSSNEYRPTRVVVGKRDQLPSVERHGAVVPQCPCHVSLS